MNIYTVEVYNLVTKTFNEQKFDREDAAILYADLVSRVYTAQVNITEE